MGNCEKKIIWPGSTQLAPVPAVLVGCGNGIEFKFNLITVAWCGIVCSKPAMLSISLRPERYSYNIIRTLGEFTVNIPRAQDAALVDYCGVLSGREHDKFAECGLTPYNASAVNAPLVGEFPINLECRTTQILELGIHHMFVAKIVAVQVSESAIDANGTLQADKNGLLGYGHGHYYEVKKRLGHFGFSVRKKPGAKIR
ncbi:MAG: flavin reductase family protein [Lentisphaeria bacterium]|nr:flavin reductase family protein [Lentisphaeria bacterium]